MSAILFVGLPVQDAAAASVLRTNFSPLATNFDLDAVGDGTVAASDGFATFSNGVAMSLNMAPFTGLTYYDANDASVIRLDFANTVAKVGMDFLSNNAATTLSVFNTSGTLLEAITLQTADMPLNVMGYPGGFIGIGRASADISFLTIDTALTGNELYVDNVVYDAVPAVPVPAALPLLATALLGAGLYSRRRRG